jgi:hypothetical protein
MSLLKGFHLNLIYNFRLLIGLNEIIITQIKPKCR